MRILHSSLMLHEPSGILNQLRWERDAAAQLGIDWSVKLAVGNQTSDESDILIPLLKSPMNHTTIVSRARTWYMLKAEYYKWLVAASKDYDVLVLRHSTADPFFSHAVKTIKKPIFSVHHTAEGFESRILGKLGHLKKVCDDVLFNRQCKYLAGLVSLTPEISRYEIDRSSIELPMHIYPNGINLDEVKNENPQHFQSKFPRIIFVASHFSPWHGLDKIIDSLKTTSEKLELHLVGAVPSELAQRVVGDRRVKLHGRLEKDALKKLYASCDIGLSAFALERNNMSEACALKVREALAYGVPIFSSYKDVFPKDFPYYRVGSPDISEMIKYHNDMVSISRDDVRNAAAPYISKTILLDSFHKWIVGNLSESERKYY